MHCASCWSQQNRWSLNGLYSFFGHIFDLKLVGPKVEEMRGADCGRMDVICSNDERRLWGPWRAQILKPTKEEEFSILSDWKDFNKAAKALEEVKMRSTEMLFLHEKKERPQVHLLHDFIKTCKTRPLFRLFLVFSNKQFKFYNKREKCPVLGFEHTYIKCIIDP